MKKIMIVLIALIAIGISIGAVSAEGFSFSFGSESNTDGGQFSLENNKLNLPKVWGQGAIFAHSGLDGVDTLENSLVGLLMADRIGMEFKTPIPSYVYFKLKDVQDVIYDLISNDLIKASLLYILEKIEVTTGKVVRSIL